MMVLPEPETASRPSTNHLARPLFQIQKWLLRASAVCSPTHRFFPQLANLARALPQSRGNRTQVPRAWPANDREKTVPVHQRSSLILPDSTPLIVTFLRMLVFKQG